MGKSVIMGYISGIGIGIGIGMIKRRRDCVIVVNIIKNQITTHGIYCEGYRTRVSLKFKKEIVDFFTKDFDILN